MPNPQAKAIAISERQKNILEQITRRITNPYRLVRRAQLILLAGEGVNNSKISQQLQLQRNQVRLWRQRWQLAKESLRKMEAEGNSDPALKEGIINVLSDKFRRGSNPKFTVEQIVQIIAIACEDPGQSERPVSHWTPKELADEAVKRDIDEPIHSTQSRPYSTNCRAWEYSETPVCQECAWLRLVQRLCKEKRVHEC